MTLDLQFITMLSMIAGGFYLGCALDTFRRLAVYWKQRTIMKYVMEITFWLMQTLLLYYVLFRINSGELRFYIFIALLLGFAAYQALLAKTYKQLLEYLLRIISKVYRVLVETVRIMIITPIKFIIQLIVRITVSVAKMLWSLIRFSLRVIGTPIVWLLRMVFRMLPRTIQRKLHQMAGFYSTIENTCRTWINKLTSKRR